MRKWGQHFLISKDVQKKIVEACQITPKDEILEIGPGQGELTQHYLNQVSRAVLIEIDPELCRRIKNRWPNASHLEILQKDFRTLDASALLFHQKPIVLSDLPYYASKPVLRKILEWRAYKQAILTFQKEVALRLTAKASDSHYGALSVITQLEATVEKLFDIEPRNFRPPPKIVSTVVKIVPQPYPPSLEKRAKLYPFIRICFAQKRKTLVNNLHCHLKQIPKKKIEEILENCSISPTARAQEINLNSFDLLADKLNEFSRKSTEKMDLL